MRKTNTIKHDFLCVGFAKCGTTTLQKIFKNHKDLYLPAIKETYLYFSKGYEWYKRRYYDRNIQKKVIGEFNPCYNMAVNTRSTDAIAEQIRQDFGPDIKLIFMLRNPVDKLYSWYKYALPYGWVYERPADNLVPNISEGFRQHVWARFRWDENGENVTLALGENPRTHYELEGEYARFIDSFLKFFPQENLKFIVFEEFAQDPEAVCRELLDFIGLEEDPSLRYDEIANEGNRAPRSAGSIWCIKGLNRLRHYYNKYVPFISYNTDWTVMRLFLRLENGLTKPLRDFSQMDSQTRKVLENFYRKDKKAVEDLLGRDLSGLWFP